MRKFVVVLILTTFGLISNGQTGPVFPYTHPSKATLQELSLDGAIKGYIFSTYLVEKINLGLADTTVRVSRANIISIFEHLFLEEVYLKEGSYMNSGYNPLKTKMDPSVGHEWTGFAWVFRMGTYVIIIIKEDCGNILTVPVIRKVIFVSQPRPEPRPDPTPDWRKYEAPKKVYPNQPPPPPPLLPLIIIPEHSGFYLWQCKNGWWADTLFGIALGFVAHDRNHRWYLWFDKPKKFIEPKIIEPRTMPDGIPAVPTPSTPGVPSDPRTMPGGTGFVPNFGGGITIFRF